MEFIKGLAESFYSPHFYSDLARKKQGIGGLYILALSVLMLMIAPLVLMQSGFYTGSASLAANIRTLPTVTVHNGHLSIDKPMPYVFAVAPDANIMIDTTYKITDLSALADKMKKEKTLILFTGDSMVTADASGVKVQDLGKCKDSPTTKCQDVNVTAGDWNDMAQWFEGARGMLLLAIFGLMMLGGLFLGRLVVTFFTAIVVAIAGTIARSNLDFGAAMRLAAALSIPTTLLTFLPFVGSLVGWLIWFAYITFAVVSCRVAPPAAAV